MKKHGVDFYEIGLHQLGSQFCDFPDKKQLDITHFKKGYGGFVVPFFMGEKYYDKTFFLEIYNERINRFASELPN
jgi:hypothetical protein